MSIKKLEIGYGAIPVVEIGEGMPLVFIGGPCAIETRDHAFMMADRIGAICRKVGVNWIYKSCFDKDCRSSPESFHGVGVDEGLSILARVREKFAIPVVSDFSNPAWAPATGEVCDLIQVPAYLCRQTSILKAAAETGRPIHLKKGQYMSPWNMKNSVRKIEGFGGSGILLTERGTFFGYSQLVNDMTSLPIMNQTGYPVCYDATHSIQLPTSMGNISGGQRQFIPNLIRAATACGVQAIFMEVHDDPPRALSDANTVLHLQYLEQILYQAKVIHETRLELLDKFGIDDVHPV